MTSTKQKDLGGFQLRGKRRGTHHLSPLPKKRAAKRKLASRGVVAVGIFVEAGAVGDLHLDVVEAGVARHEDFRSVIEADRRGILECVVDELGAVGLLDLEALIASDEGVFLENVVLGPSRVHHVGRVGSKVREGVVPEQGRR